VVVPGRAGPSVGERQADEGPKLTANTVTKQTTKQAATSKITNMTMRLALEPTFGSFYTACFSRKLTTRAITQSGCL
jgi:hypothetical protein